MKLRYECEVIGHGCNQQVIFGSFRSFGQIVDFSEHWHDEPGTEVVHSEFIDEDGNEVELFYTVPQTEYNTPLVLFVD